MGGENLGEVYLRRGRYRKGSRPRLEPDDIVAQDIVRVVIRKGDKQVALFRGQAYSSQSNRLDDCGVGPLGPSREKVLGECENGSIIGDDFYLTPEFGYEI